MTNTVKPNPVFNYDLAEQEKVYNKFIETYKNSNVHNIVDIYENGMRVSASRPCLGTRSGEQSPYTWQTYQEVYNQAHQVGSFLKSQLKLKKGDFVGIFSKNRAEWVILELGCFMFGFVVVPLYDTLGSQACEYIIDQTKIKVLLVETLAQVSKLVTVKTANFFKDVILIEKTVDKKTENSDKTIWNWLDVLRLGKNHLEPKSLPTEKDLAVLCYTSGTTGNPKGSQMTHGNLVQAVLGITEFLRIYSEPYDCQITAEDVHISYLPLAHSFERLMQAKMFFDGASIGFYRGDIKTLVDDMHELKPTIFVTVPRLLTKIYDKTLDNAKNSCCLKYLIYKTGFNSKLADVDKGVIRRDTIWDKLVFSKIQNRLGGRVRFVLTGAAPISHETLRFARVAFGCPVIEGYGQTECTAACSATIPGVNCPGSIGVPVPCNMIRLVDVPDLNYLSKNKQGEIQIKGPHVFTGYYNLPEETKKTLTKDGWLQTGDIGQWSPEGYLQIIDRQKHLFKLSHGEYIAPEKIENIYINSSYVAQIFVEGRTIEFFLIAIVVPNEEVVLPWAKKNNQPENMKELCKSDLLKDTIFRDLRVLGDKANLKSFEKVKAIHLHHEQFSIENDLLTPTMKSKRFNLRAYFDKEISALYEQQNMGASKSSDV